MTTWAELDPADQLALLSSPSLRITPGCDLLNFDLSVADDALTDDLDPANGTVQWTGAATVHRGCTVTLSRRLDWGNALVRIYRTYTDPLSRLTARANRGVFVLTAPDTHLAETPQSWEVQGQDRGVLLDRQIGYSYIKLIAGGNILAGLAQVFTDAGLTGVLIDSTAAGKTFPQAMPFPLLSATTDTTTTADAPSALPPDIGSSDTSGAALSGPYTWRQVINEICKLINYRFVYCNDDGYFVCEPYVVPAARPALFALDADTIKSTVAVDRTESGNYYGRDTPSAYRFIWTNMPDVSDGAGGTVPATPTTGNGGIYERTITTGPTSAGARNGLDYPTQIDVTAASAADVIAQGDAKIAADLQRQVAWTGKTVPFPFSHFDVVALTDSGLDNSPWLAEATAWTEHLDGSDTDLTVTKVG